MEETGKKKEVMVDCRLKKNNQFGTAIRKGKSGRKYVFTLAQTTLVLEKDLKGLQDKKSDQYVQLEIVKDV